MVYSQNQGLVHLTLGPKILVYSATPNTISVHTLSLISTQFSFFLHLPSLLHFQKSLPIYHFLSLLFIIILNIVYFILNLIFTSHYTSVYLSILDFCFKIINQKKLYLYHLTMQLNPLFIISIPQSHPKTFSTLDPSSLSPTKNQITPSPLKDDISWKKSLSAFKKFKTKKDKDTKIPKNSEANQSFPNQQPSNPVINTNFSLVDNDIKFSLLTNQDNQLISSDDHFDYFDPNDAPFFEFGVTYNFPQHRLITEKLQEAQEPLKLTKKYSSTPRIRKEHSKKDKSKTQNLDNEISLKKQKDLTQQDPNFLELQPGCDPFIIVKASELRQKQLNDSGLKDQSKKLEQVKKKKSIKKKTKYVSRSMAIYPRDIYSHQITDECDDNEDCDNSKSVGYGNDQLPIIQFDFSLAIAPKLTESDSGFDNLPIYQAKESSQVRARMRPFIHTNEILQEYVFNSELIPKEDMIESQEGIQINEEALEKA